MTRGVVLWIGIFVTGAAIGYLTHGAVHSHCCDKLTYINEDIGRGEMPTIRKGSYLAFETDLQATIKAAIKSGDIDTAAVFFRDLRDGPIFDVNGEANFAPASLLKLPVVLAYMSLAEENPEILEEKLTYSAEGIQELTQISQIEKPVSRLVEGESYTVEKLLEESIEQSDNLAYYVLVYHLNNDVENGTYKILRTFQELGIVDPRNIADEVVSTRNYSALFRILYNASYISTENSDKVLSWLARSAYTKGIVAGVPAGVEVSHKFGERALADGTKQLHDCGIVYYTDNPYVLCVMTTGTDWDKLTHTIATISQMTYDEVLSRRQ